MINIFRLKHIFYGARLFLGLQITLSSTLDIVTGVDGLGSAFETVSNDKIRDKIFPFLAFKQLFNEDVRIKRVDELVSDAGYN